jgi:hypothetical protein
VCLRGIKQDPDESEETSEPKIEEECDIQILKQADVNALAGNYFLAGNCFLSQFRSNR